MKRKKPARGGKRGPSHSDGVSNKNKDVLFKALSEAYRNKSFSAYGIDLPPIKEVLPTNLPKISADEKGMDNFFLLEDGTYVIVDYESEYRRSNKVKYLNYVARVVEKYFVGDVASIKLKVLVIYTGDVEKADPVFETDCLMLRTEQVFLSKIDGKGEFSRIKEKIEKGVPLDNADVMRLIILPLTQKGNEGKQKMVEDVVDVTESIEDEKLRLHILSSMFIASDKFIDREYLERMRRRISMTQLGQLYEKEKIEYGNEKAKKAKEEVVKQYVRTMLEKEMDMVDIMEVTGLTEDEILSIQDE